MTMQQEKEQVDLAQLMTSKKKQKFTFRVFWMLDSFIFLQIL